jgi:hypothetical protein
MIFFRNDVARRSPAVRDLTSSDSDRDNASEEKGSDHVRNMIKLNFRHVFTAAVLTYSL